MKIFNGKKYFFTAVALVLCLSNAHGSWCTNKEAIHPEIIRRVQKSAFKFNGEMPSALPKIKTEGLLPGQGLYNQSIEAKEDFKKTEALALGWLVTKNKDLSLLAEIFLLDWAKKYKPTGNPIDETNFTILFNSFAILESQIKFENRIIIKNWILDFYKVHIDEIKRLEAANKTQVSNWQSHRIKIALISAAATDSEDLIDLIEPYFHDHVERNILPDGSVADFHSRDSINYAVYSLKPILETAFTVKSVGKDWLAKNSLSKKRIFSAVDWLGPYINGSLKHIEFANSSVRFDRIRSEANLPGHLVAAWDPQNAHSLIWVASYLDIKYISTAERLKPSPPIYMAVCHGMP